jgi:hypothetical protein
LRLGELVALPLVVGLLAGSVFGVNVVLFLRESLNRHAYDERCIC